MAARKQRLEPENRRFRSDRRPRWRRSSPRLLRFSRAHGYAAGTTNRIAERAGVSIGTLYQYFPSKEAMAVALLERHIDDTAQRLHEWVAPHGRRAARPARGPHDYVTGMLEMHSGQPRLQHILLEETPLPERVHQALARRRAPCGQDRGRPAASVSGGPARQTWTHAGFLVVQTVESLTHRFAAHPGRADHPARQLRRRTRDDACRVPGGSGTVTRS